MRRIQFFNAFLFMLLALSAVGCFNPMIHDGDAYGSPDGTNSGAARAVIWPDGKKYIGTGVDTITGNTIGIPFGDNYTTYYQEVRNTHEVTRFIRNFKELNDEFNLYGELGVSLPIGLKFSAKAKILEKTTFSDDSIAYLFSSACTIGEVFIGEWTLTAQAQKMLNENPNLFYKTYGQAYLAKAELGGRLTIIYQLSNIDYSKTSELQLSGLLEGMIGCLKINAQADYSKNLAEVQKYCNVSLDVDAVGFIPGPYNIMDVSTLFALVNNYHTYIQNLPTTKNFGACEYVYGDYAVQNSDPRLAIAFQTATMWISWRESLADIRKRNYNSDINYDCDTGLIKCAQMINDCYDLSKAPFVQPKVDEFDYIYDKVERLFEKDLYFLKEGNREFYLPTKTSTYANDLQQLKSFLTLRNDPLGSFVLPEDQYTFKIYQYQARKTSPIYQSISSDTKSSPLYSLNAIDCDRMMTNYAWIPVMNKRILGYVKDTVIAGDASFQKFRNQIAKPINVDCIPVLTQNSNGGTYGHIASCSSFFGNNALYDAWRAFDGDDTSTSWSRWISKPSGTFTPAWLSYDIGDIPVGNPKPEYTPAYIRSYYILPEFGGCANRAPKTWSFQGYNRSKGVWETIDTRSNISITGAAGTGWLDNSGTMVGKTFTITSVIKPYKKFRLYITATNGSDAVSIRQFKLFY